MTEDKVREVFEKFTTSFVSVLHDLAAIMAAEGQKAESEARGNLAGALEMPLESNWDDLVSSATMHRAELRNLRGQMGDVIAKRNDLERQRNALQVELAKEAARSASAELERDAALKAKASAQADSDALMWALREHDGKEQSLRRDLDLVRAADAGNRELLRAKSEDLHAASMERERIRADLAREIAAHMETKAALKEAEDKASRHEHMRTMAEHDREQAEQDAEAGSRAYSEVAKIRDVLVAGPRESTRDAAARVAGEVSQLKASWQLEHDLLTAAEAALTQSHKEIEHLKNPSAFLDVVFDGPPSHDSGRFVEVEDPQGKSVNAGEWIDRKDGLWALRIPMDRPAGIQATNDDRVGQRISIQNNYRAELNGCDPPDDPRDSDAPVAAFAPAPEKTAQAAIDWTRHDIVKLTQEEIEALRLPDPGMFHGQPGAWYRRGDGLFVGYADLAPDFEGPGGPIDSVMRRSLSVIADLKERLEVTGKALATVSPDRDPAALDGALILLRSEAKRLRSGAGGFGGGSPHAAGLANAIESVIARFQ